MSFRIGLALAALALLAPVAAADPRVEANTSTASEAPAAALGPPAPPVSPTLLPLLESGGLMLVGAAGVAAAVLLARRAE